MEDNQSNINYEALESCFTTSLIFTSLINSNTGAYSGEIKMTVKKLLQITIFRQ